MNKLNKLWLRYRQWGKDSIIGDFVVSMSRIAFIVAVFSLLFYGLFVVGPFKDTQIDSSLSDSSDTANENCTVTGINLHGELFTYIPIHAENDSLFNYNVVSSENIIGAIKEANENESIKALVIEVDSGGGSPVAGEEIANALKSSEKPVVAFIRELGASSSYWAISSAGKIFASKNSNVGGIGITSSYLSNVEKNKKDGYTYEQLSAGKFKDSGSADRLLTVEEKVLFMRDINIVYQNFIEAISKNRNIPIEKVKSFADGSTVLGEKAKSLGLIDDIGGIREVEKYLEEITGEKPDVRYPFFKTENQLINLSLT